MVLLTRLQWWVRRIFPKTDSEAAIVKERVATGRAILQQRRLPPCRGRVGSRLSLRRHRSRRNTADQENKMLGKLASRSAAITIVGVALTGTAAAATLRTHGVTRFSHVYGDGSGPAHFGVTSHFGQPAARLGSPSGGDYASHPHGGWYSRGFGGTLDPGWGYRFGPNLGGS
jgi:hypothetical protein